MREVAKLGDYIKKNYKVVDRLLKSGKVSLSVKQEFEIYQYYQTTKNIKSKMQRYSNTASAMKVSEVTVMRAVKEMKKVI